MELLAQSFEMSSRNSNIMTDAQLEGLWFLVACSRQACVYLAGGKCSALAALGAPQSFHTPLLSVLLHHLQR